MKIGTRVKAINKYFKTVLGKVGTVTKVIEHGLENPDNPIEDHGVINVKFDDFEHEAHFVHYEWEKFLEIVEEVNDEEKN